MELLKDQPQCYDMSNRRTVSSCECSLALDQANCWRLNRKWNINSLMTFFPEGMGKGPLIFPEETCTYYLSNS